MMVWSVLCVVITAFTCATFLVDTDRFRSVFIGPIPWGHSGPLCHALSSSSSSWTSHAACAIAIAGVRQ